MLRAGNELKNLALEMSAFKTNSLKTRVHYTLHLIGTVHVYIQAIAFSAGPNGIQVDQVNREDNSRAGILDKWCREHILS